MWADSAPFQAARRWRANGSSGLPAQANPPPPPLPGRGGQPHSQLGQRSCPGPQVLCTSPVFERAEKKSERKPLKSFMNVNWHNVNFSFFVFHEDIIDIHSSAAFTRETMWVLYSPILLSHSVPHCPPLSISIARCLGVPTYLLGATLFSRDPTHTMCTNQHSPESSSSFHAPPLWEPLVAPSVCEPSAILFL